MIDMTKGALDRAPVIVGLGEALDRECTKEPRALIGAAIEEAINEAPKLASSIDLLGVVNVASWRYAEIGALLAGDARLSPRETWESEAGGEKPIRLLGQAAERIARGELRAALLCGGEATRTRAAAARDKHELDWGPTDRNVKPLSATDFVTPFAARYGLVRPIDVYPLYENATRHAWGLSQQEADRESAELWSRYSEAAFANSYAWIRRHYAAEEISADSPDNRLIAFPYRKLMVANPMVNQAAAILLTSRAFALAAGVPEQKLVYLGAGAWANEPADFLVRDRFDRSTAQDAVLNAVLDRNGVSAKSIDTFEVYSCFPVVPKMARRALGLDASLQPSIAGGLTFFGAPANNYMMHAVTAAARALRQDQRKMALLYGQGEYVTKHAAVLLGADPFAARPEMLDAQAIADADAEQAPPLACDYSGEGHIETFTINYGRDGTPTQAAVVVRTSTGARTVALIPGDDGASIEQLASGDPIGQSGTIAANENGLQRFRWLPA